jgi:hypothetical protein
MLLIQQTDPSQPATAITRRRIFLVLHVVLHPFSQTDVYEMRLCKHSAFDHSELQKKTFFKVKCSRRQKQKRSHFASWKHPALLLEPQYLMVAGDLKKARRRTKAYSTYRPFASKD